MAGFWDLPAPEDLPTAGAGELLGEIRHTITHHRYRLAVRRATAPPGKLPAPFRWREVSQLGTIPLSTTARKALALV